MSYQKIPPPSFVQRLIDAGIIPPLCMKWSLELKANSSPRIHCEVIPTPEQLDEIAKALVDHPEEIASIERFVVKHDIHSTPLET